MYKTAKEEEGKENWKEHNGLLVESGESDEITYMYLSYYQYCIEAV